MSAALEQGEAVGGGSLPPHTHGGGIVAGRADHHLRGHRHHAGHAGGGGLAGSVHVSGSVLGCGGERMRQMIMEGMLGSPVLGGGVLALHPSALMLWERLDVGLWAGWGHGDVKGWL